MTGSDASSPPTARDASSLRKPNVILDLSASRGSLSAPAFTPLRKRAEFLSVGKGDKFHVRTFSLQALLRVAVVQTDATPGKAYDLAPPRFGLTITRKTGGSVERNRMRRRLREALRRAAPLAARPGTDYVVVARREALHAPFDRLIDDLSRAMRLIGDKSGSKSFGKSFGKSGSKPGAPQKPANTL
jgi:ribonuclease P protein component